MSDVIRYATRFAGEDTLEPGLFQKEDGTVWIRNPDGSETQVTGGGGSQPSGQQTFYGDDFSVPAGTAALLPINPGSTMGDTLLEFPDPFTLGVIVITGTYVITATYAADDALTVGQCFQAYLDLDFEGADISFDVFSPPATAAANKPRLMMSSPFEATVGMKIGFTVKNLDSGAKNFYIRSAIITRVG